MECLSAASISFPYIRRASIQGTVLRNQKVNFNRISFQDKSSNFSRAKFQLPRAQNTPAVFEEEQRLSSNSSQNSPAVISEAQILSSLSQDDKVVRRNPSIPPYMDKVPEPLRSYILLARLHRDIGVWLQAWPSYWYSTLFPILYHLWS
jgi:hypothetical protein